jgi:hypothetical protein
VRFDKLINTRKVPNMPSLNRKLFAATALVAFAAFPPAALGGYREEMHVTSVEISLLPTFCWKQFDVPNVEGDEFHIRDCGPGMNHYCPGLIYLIRGKRTSGKNKALPLIQHADIDVRYTENAMADYPKCSVRDHVVKTRMEINSILQMYGSKPAGGK